jgi:uncharacterized protein RhaS with RHS repeats
LFGPFLSRFPAPNGTFTQEDPIGIAGGLNLYGYANGDPINFGDPFGLCPDGCVLEGAVLLGFAAAASTSFLLLTEGEALGSALEQGFNAGRDIFGGVMNAVSAKIHGRHLQGQVNNINTHFGKIGGPGGEDPNNRDKWVRDIQKGIREMGKRIEKLSGKNREQWQEVVRGIEERLSNVRGGS